MKLSKTDIKRLEGVDCRLVKVVLVAAEIYPLPITIAEGLRTIERQKQLLKEGKTKTLQSKHLKGLAVDVYPLTADRKKIDGTAYDKLSAAMKEAASIVGVKIQWGGDWRTFIDKPHYELCE